MMKAVWNTLILSVCGMHAADAQLLTRIHDPRCLRTAPQDLAFGPTEQDFDRASADADRSWEFIVIHHSATESGSVESIHREHRQRKDRNGQPWLGIGYHFVIGNGSGMPDGEISETFRWTQQIHGAHSGSIRHNARGIGICLIGNFEQSRPTTAQQDAAVRLIAWLIERYGISTERIIGHQQIRATSCPGRLFPMSEILQRSVNRTQSPDNSHESP